MRISLRPLAALLFSSILLAGPTRLWTSTDGRTIDAAYVSHDANAVSVVINGAKKIAVIPLFRLSEVDKAWLAERPPITAEQKPARLIGRVVSITPDGALLEIKPVPRVESAGIPGITYGNTKPYNPDAGRPARATGIVLLSNYPTSGLVDDDLVDVDGVSQDTYQYKTALGALKTVRSYHVTNFRFAE